MMRYGGALHCVAGLLMIARLIKRIIIDLLVFAVWFASCVTLAARLLRWTE
jgi:hypothetical protein